MEQRNPRRARIAVRIVLFAVISCIVLGVTTILAGLVIYADSLQQVFISRARSTAVRAAAAVQNSGDAAGLSADVMAVYNSLTREERSRTGTEEYRNLFRSAGSAGNPDGSGFFLADLLENYRTDVSGIAVCALDRKNSALVCLANAAGGVSRSPGDWFEIPADWAEKIAENQKPDGTEDSALCFFRNTKETGRECLAVYPVLDEGADAAGEEERNPVCLVAELTIDSVNEKAASYTLRVSIVMLALTLLIAFAAGWHMKRTVAAPIETIAETASAYARDKMNGVARSDHFSSIGIHTGDELENLTGVMAGMERDLAEHEEEIRRNTAEKERIRTELDLARQIQSGALPSAFPAFPDRGEFELFASMTPARDVGGDFYDFFLIDDDHLALVIADVSGKGIPAALFMMVAKSLIKNQLLSGCDPAQAMAHANAQLCEGNASSSFVTVWAAVLQLSTGKGVACNAGHEHPCLRRSGEPFGLLKYKHNMVVGVLKTASYRNREFELGPGDSLFVYTDGVPEAKNPEGGMFGEERLTEVLNRNPDASPEELADSARRALDDFVRDEPQFDDITMLAFRYSGPGRNTRQGKGSGNEWPCNLNRTEQL